MDHTIQTCDNCHKYAASTDLIYVENPGSDDEHGAYLSACEAPLCWTRVRDAIDKRGGLYQQTQYLQPAEYDQHRRNHDIPVRVVKAFRTAGLTDGYTPPDRIFHTCVDCGGEYSTTAVSTRCAVNAARVRNRNRQAVSA